uniref:glutaminyl-peptide cyclotransferase n=1 Tax=Soboliphyme baturini TaxID=241478 RepID=A0A183I978_9BILA
LLTYDHFHCFNSAPYLINRTNYFRSLQLLFLDGEEAFKNWSKRDSLYGSRKLCEELEAHPYPAYGHPSVTELHRIDAFVLLDLLGAPNCYIYNYEVNDKKVYKYFPDTEEKLRKIKSCLPLNRQIFKRDMLFGYAVEDDHLPFFERGVKIVHLIPAHFPSVWHTLNDTASSLYWPVIDQLAVILRVFTARYLKLKI